MGRTQTSITQAFDEYASSLARFCRALRREDQRLLDELFARARQHVAAIAQAAHLLPYELFLLAMLLETYKEVHLLRARLEACQPTQPALNANNPPD